MKAQALLAGCILGLAVHPQAQAEEPMARHWIARLGVHPVSPKTDSHTDFKVDNAAGISVSATYLFTQHWGLELFGTFPRAQALRDPEADRVGSFKMIPMSATVQYHISDDADRFRVYAGVGVSHASIGHERTKGLLAGTVLELDDSTGVTAALGLDMKLASKWHVTVDARWMDIDSTMKLNGIGSGRLGIDPYLFGLSIGRRLR
jgi:outer membrane protein